VNAPDNSPDGGAAFPFYFPTPMAGDASEQHQGMSCRALFAAILIHAELVTCGVPGEAADALVEAAQRAGRDVVDHMAFNAVESADALLRALAEPRPEPVPQHLTYNAWATPASEHHAIQSLWLHPRFADLPAVIRDFVKLAVDEIAKTEDGIPF